MKSIYLFAAVLLISCSTQGSKTEQPLIEVDYQKLDTATFAGGCFWCVEASFEQIKGVVEAVSGYSGGSAENATYKKVSYGLTKHAEAVQVYYDPNVIDYSTLLDIFFTAHDPTQVNRQGPDVGEQYRSVIFYHDATQRQLAVEKMKALASEFDKPIATQLVPLDAFYEAEDYHQDYEKKNPYQPYILSVSKPKIERVAKKFKHLLKEEG